jgi:hypothetical protein
VRSEAGRRVWIFAEADYLFGSGPLHLIVEKVDWSTPRTHDGQTWFDVTGIEVSADGRVIGPREAMVRATRLRAPNATDHPA